MRARQQNRWLLRRPDVALIASPRIAQGDLEVDAEPLDPSLVAAAATGLRPVELEGPRPPRAPIPGTGVIDDVEGTAMQRIPLPGVLLPAGEHVLAISLHNPTKASTDLRLAGITLVEVEAAPLPKK